MDSKTYYIYHIPGVKIGCTNNLKHRIRKYPKNTEYEVLESYDDIYVASDRELLLQKRYGYSVDNVPYWKTIKTPTYASRSKGGKTTTNKDSWTLIRKLGNEIKKKCIIQYDKDGNFIYQWSSISEASRKCNLPKGNITRACQGKLKTCGGFIFKYKND